MRNYPKEFRLEIFNKYNGRCAYCGCQIQLKAFNIDHIISKEYWSIHWAKMPYELDDPRNLNPACRTCNLWKDSNSLEEFREQISKQIERVNLESSNYRIAKKYNLVVENPHPIKFYFETI